MSFPPLPDDAIVTFFVEKTDKKDVPVTLANLKSPTRESVMVIFTFFMKEIMSFNLDATLVLPFNAAPVPHMEMYQDRTPFLRFFGCMRHYLALCHYFTFSTDDLNNPKASRFRRQLSALINFSLFWEKRDEEFGEEVMRQCVEEIEQCDRFEKENAELKEKMQEDLRKIEDCKIIIAQEEANVTRLNSDLSSLNEKCEQLPKQLRHTKAEAAKLGDECQSDVVIESQLCEEIGVLQSQLVSSPDKQRQLLRDTEDKLREVEQERDAKLARRGEVLLVRQELERLLVDVDHFSSSLDDHLEECKRLDEAQKKSSSHKNELDSLGGELRRLQDAIHVLENKIRVSEEGMESGLLKEQEYLSVVESELEQRQQLLQRNESQLNDNQQRLSAAEKTAGELDQQLQQLQLEYDERDQALATEEQLIESQVDHLTSDVNGDIVLLLTQLKVQCEAN